MNNLIIASAHRDRITKWRQGLDGLVTATLLNDRLASLGSEVAKLDPEVLLLDFDLLGSNGMVTLHSICAETRTVVIGGDIPESVEWELVKAGVRGYCRGDSGPVMLKQVVESVHRGELWIRRKLTCRLIDELGKSTAKNKAYQTSLGLLNKLTMREFDIAVRVGNGESNKQIANSCGITERTVKAHLTEVFIKLGVTDRLNLALVLAADGRNPELENSDNLLVSKARRELNQPLIMGQLNQ
ncbi:MAG: response regulator transcription factor [Gammaproteobacteria bacterium]|nr:response regulator transcription factor [Gammaproteobacteria bacterium]MBU1776045.1 response regulator transcription factor [Gammaproteobacteria bacterium]MBU1969746.1 response regulator transcription factor [Gammaproteobacteria bacterium]